MRGLLKADLDGICRRQRLPWGERQLLLQLVLAAADREAPDPVRELERVLAALLHSAVRCADCPGMLRPNFLWVVELLLEHVRRQRAGRHICVDQYRRGERLYEIGLNQLHFGRALRVPRRNRFPF